MFIDENATLKKYMEINYVFKIKKESSILRVNIEY